LSHKIWKRPENLISGQEYDAGNQLFTKVSSEKGFSALIDEYVYIHPENVENRKLKNDNNVKEVFVNYDLGAFRNRKVAFILRSIQF